MVGLYFIIDAILLKNASLEPDMVLIIMMTMVIDDKDDTSDHTSSPI